MIQRIVYVIITFAFLVASQDVKSNSTDFIATKEWQEIRPGQRIPQGLHYRINLQTGYKEAKLLEENEKAALLATEESKDDEIDEKDSNNDVEIEAARKRLEEALKNIPADTFNYETEKEWKDISSKYKSYDQLKEDLKDLKMNMKTEAELLKELLEQYQSSPADEFSSEDDKIKLLEEFEYLSHSIDNSLLFISLGGMEEIIIPNLNASSTKRKIKSIKLLGVILQNNNEAKSYVIEKTNIDNYLINILSKSINNQELLSSALFAYGSLSRNNRKISSDSHKKGLTVLMNIIKDEAMTLALKTKALVLLNDLLSSDELKDQDLSKFIETLEMCNHLDNFFSLNKQNLCSDSDSLEKTLKSFLDLKEICQKAWSESSNYRHTLLVVLSRQEILLKVQLDESEDVYKDIILENIEHLEHLNQFLYADLKIIDDLSQKYSENINDEL